VTACGNRSFRTFTTFQAADQTATWASIEAALESAMEAVRKLDVIVANRLHDDAVTMAVWERERRVGYPKSGVASATSAAAPAVRSVVAPTAPVSAPQTT
jgi:diaminopimelate epimerase